MLTPPRRLFVIIMQTADGDHEYVRIESEDRRSLDIMLIASEIRVEDLRTNEADNAKA